MYKNSVCFSLCLPILPLPLIQFEDVFTFFPIFIWARPWENACIYPQHWGISLLLFRQFLPHFRSANLELCNIFQLNYEKHNNVCLSLQLWCTINFSFEWAVNIVFILTKDFIAVLFKPYVHCLHYFILIISSHVYIWVKAKYKHSCP